jgi:hypothetical protein
MRAMKHSRSLVSLATGLILLAVAWSADPRQQDRPVAFFLVGDTHLLGNTQNRDKLDERSAALSERLINMLNELPGSDVPQDAGGGTVLAPYGVIHAGDCIDTGDQSDLKMQETEWDAFVKAFGLTGRDGGVPHEKWTRD